MTASHDREPTAATLGATMQTHEPVILQDDHRPQHISIIGRTGYGKTTILEHLILEDLRANTSAILIDPHGDLSQRIISLATPEERKRITLLEVWPQSPFKLNLLECPDSSQLDRTVDDILTLFHRLFDTGDPQIGHRLHRYFGNALRTLIPNGRTLADVQRLFYDDAFRAGMLRGVRNRKVLEFWQVYEQIPHKDRTNQLESTINRLEEFLSSETALAMVSAEHSTVPLANVLNRDGQIFLIRIPVGELGEQQARFYGSLLLSLLTDRLFARAYLPQSARHRLHLYLDEYGWFATSTTAALLQQARKYNLGATIAFQTLADLPDEKNKQAALQVGTFIVLRLIGQNADELVSEFPVIPRPQSRETIWEPVGTKSVRAISPNPVEDLIANSHSEKPVRDAINAYLKPRFGEIIKLQRRLSPKPSTLTFTPIRGGRFSRPAPPISSPSPTVPDHMQEAFDLLNSLLITVMEQQQNLTHEPLALIAAEIFNHLTRAYDSAYLCDIGPSGNNTLHSTLPSDTTPEFVTKLGQHIQHAARAYSQLNTEPSFYFPFIRHGGRTVWAWLESRAHEYYNEQLDKTPEPSLPWDETVRDKYKELREKSKYIRREFPDYSTTEEDQLLPQLEANNAHRSRSFHLAEKEKHTETIYQYAEQIETDAAHLIILCKILTTDPVTTLTGQLEDDIRPRHIILPPQTHADARVELAGILANLKQYTAFYQISGSHGQVALAAPLEPGHLDEEAIKEVRERSRSLYGVPLESPDDNPPASRPPGPRIGRRPSRADN